jgi:hypothetical protein
VDYEGSLNSVRSLIIPPGSGEFSDSKISKAQGSSAVELPQHFYDFVSKAIQMLLAVDKVGTE